MRAAGHARLADPSCGLQAGLRRSVGLALATVAALVTLLLPAPALARGVNAAFGSVAATGATTTGSTQHAERRTHRGAQLRSGRAGDAVSAPATDASDASSLLRSSALVGPSHAAGPSSLAALPSTPGPVLASLRAATGAGSVVVPSAGGSGAWSSRAPPAV